MGRRNKERRAAKKRERRRSGAQTGRPGRGHGQDGGHHDWSAAGPAADDLAAGLHAAAVDHAKGDPDAPRDCAAQLAGGDFREYARTVDRAAEIALGYVIGAVWQGGWLPYDVHQHVRRRLGQVAASLITDAIAAEVRQYAPATMHQRWQEQLDEINAEIWWTRDSPHLTQWASRHRRGRDEALASVIELLATLIVLPQLPPVLPPPGSARTAGSSAAARAGNPVDEKILARVRALLAKAEATSFGEEAEALSTKAQELMNRYALERAVVDAEETPAPSASARRLWLDNPYLDAKATLVDAVASANRCRSVFHPEFGFVTVLGDEVDLEIVELLTTSLLLQATRAMLAAGRQVDRRGTSRTRSFRQSFLLAYANRIGERLREATEAETAATGDPRLLPVLADRKQAVDDLYDEMFSETVRRSMSVNNASGWGAGRAAADAARLDTDRTSLEGAPPPGR